MSGALTFKVPDRWLHQPITVILAGAGGTGSQIADQLASLCVALRQLGHPGLSVSIWDPGVVREAVLGRQRFCQADIGSSKAVVLTHRINLFYGLDWTAHAQALPASTVSMAQLLITAVDKASYRAEVGAKHRHLPCEALWADAGNGATVGQVVLGHLGTPRAGLRLPNVHDLYPELASMKAADAELPSCSAEESIRRQEWPVNRAAASLLCEMLWSLIRHGSINTHGAFFQLNPFRVTPLAIDPATWAFMGYAEPKAARAAKRATA